MFVYKHGQITIRLNLDVIEVLDEEYEERGFRNRTLCLCRLIEKRDAIVDHEGTEVDAADRLAEHDAQLQSQSERLEELDERLADLEEQARPFSWTSRNS